MGLFSPDTEKDALKQIEKINREMRAISASIHRHDGLICYENRSELINHYDNVIDHVHKYEKVKSNLSEMDRVLLMGATVDVWNGERVGVFMWEHYLNNVLPRLYNDLTSL